MEGGSPQRRTLRHEGGVDVKKKGEAVKLVTHRARGIRSAGLVEEVPGEAVAVALPQRKRVTNVTVPEDSDEELPQGGGACLMTHRLRLAAAPLQVVRQKASRPACFLKCLGNGSVRECAQCLEGDGLLYVAGEQADVVPLAVSRVCRAYTPHLRLRSSPLPRFPPFTRFVPREVRGEVWIQET